MSAKISIEKITDPNIFIEKLKSPDQFIIYGYIGKYTSVSNKSYDTIKEVFDKYSQVSCIYSDLFFVRNNIKHPVFYKSFTPIVFDDNVLIHSPIFVKTKQPIVLNNDLQLKLLNSYVWLQQLQNLCFPYHIPEPLFELSMDSTIQNLLKEDTAILNAQSR